jgi:hypothetical protein
MAQAKLFSALERLLRPEHLVRALKRIGSISLRFASLAGIRLSPVVRLHLRFESDVTSTPAQPTLCFTT